MPTNSYRFLVASEDIYFQNTLQQSITFSDPESIKVLKDFYHSNSRPTLTNKDFLIVYRKEKEKDTKKKNSSVIKFPRNDFNSFEDSKNDIQNQAKILNGKVGDFENSLLPRIYDLDELSKYASLARIQSYRAKTSPDKSEWQTVILDFIVTEKVQLVELINDPQNPKVGQIIIKPVRETIKSPEIHINLINDLLEMARKAKNFRIPTELLLIVDKFGANSEYSTNEYIKGVTNTLSCSPSLTYPQKYQLFSYNSYPAKIKKLYEHIHTFAEQIKLEDEINVILKTNLDKQQTEFILKEKIKAIRKKLGEDSRYEDEIEELLHSELGKKVFPKEVAKTIMRETNKLKSMIVTSPESNITKSYLDLLVALPWKKVKKDILDIKNVREKLEEAHYGLDEIKKRIIEYLAALIHRRSQSEGKPELEKVGSDYIDSNLFLSHKIRKVRSNSIPILTLVGPPGTGKTSIAMAVAEAIGKEFVKISLGGIRDEAEIRGHRRTYVGALPGKIIQALKKVGVSNPLILLDEIDKMGADFKGDPSAAMLEVLDPEQNRFFQDHYLELEYDLSQVLFVATANEIYDIPEPLLDRVEIIELSSYTFIEKIQIAKSHLIPAVLKENALDPKYFPIQDQTIDFLIRHYTREAGVRGLKRVIDKIVRKIIVKLLEKTLDQNFVIDIEFVRELLGIEKYDPDNVDSSPQIGTVTGLGYSPLGGSTLQIEVSTIPGRGDIKLTGSLKDVMQESARIALSYVQSKAKDFGINFDFENTLIHIHVPEGAIPKDGPSAGITFATAIISALSQKPVSHNIAMTGEITLRGKVLAIGGLKEKTMGAYKNGIKIIFIPKANEKNLVDIPQEVKDVIQFIPVDTYQQIYDFIFK
ncbi:endopeptidase La [Mesomycoplasma hyopneumoniae]|uniref:Lon protease n=2 Tax=Mesomycoplasma hyopneumoniae TaxID=2099 RepID=LON_MESH2|nr:endopeptidase La [Mesomycoplasma hyopneumoniae]Q600B5.1 RecName: Full=Lon protease; AltName: Full=ATP-dependent protease La [Mesomycoplasma hyopneumoniae 232]AAV27942.1 ATP-dependent protease [Mesomycoplasma hyopneumoniae 232]AAZ44611.2 heat shock ATP-dependent protease [Mesomycoplasma hyopneumoniae J]AGQ51145.1 heat shock ATP-dependent protease [Mesomycoplasma hyopneumoniae 7422]MXR12705.1 Lon protease [Mesomycoplasma hyopneumoniae]MXR35018.1 Lon protease [Mesomycoplasma hyopneumoniae]